MREIDGKIVLMPIDASGDQVVIEPGWDEVLLIVAGYVHFKRKGIMTTVQLPGRYAVTLRTRIPQEEA